MSEPYELEKAVGYQVLRQLNNRKFEDDERVFEAYRSFSGHASTDEIRDWLLAVESGKKIVNPLSPREEVRELYYSQKNEHGERSLILDLLEIIAKEHPDVADWLGDKDE